MNDVAPGWTARGQAGKGASPARTAPRRFRHEPVGGVAGLLLFVAFFVVESTVALAAGYGAWWPGHAPHLSDAAHIACVAAAMTAGGLALVAVDRLCWQLTGYSASEIAFERW